MIYLKILAAISMLGSIAWVIFDPGFESGLAVVGSSSTLLGLFQMGKNKQHINNQNQVVSSSKSIGIQAGGNVNIETNKRKDNV